MNTKLAKNCSLILSLLALAACSSAPKQIQTAEVEQQNAPTISDLLTERMIAQITMEVEQVGVKGLQKVLGGATNQAAKVELESALKQAANQIGIKYTSAKALSDEQATALVNQLFKNSSGLRQTYMNSSDEILANVAKRQEAASKIQSNVNVNGTNERAIAKNLWEGYGRGEDAKSLVNAYLKNKHYTGADLMDAQMCGTFKKLDKPAGKNVVKLMNIQADVAEDIARANAGLSKAKIAECALTQGAIEEAVFLADTLHHPEATIADVAATTEEVCHIGRKGTAAKIRQLMAQSNSLANLKSLRTNRCN